MEVKTHDRLHITLTGEKAAKVRRIAEVEDRSYANTVNRLLEKALDEKPAKPTTPTPTNPINAKERKHEEK